MHSQQLIFGFIISWTPLDQSQYSHLALQVFALPSEQSKKGVSQLFSFCSSIFLIRTFAYFFPSNLLIYNIAIY